MASVTVRCLHCGPVAVTEPADINYIVGIVSALAVGHAPLGAITCLRCREEIRARDVEVGR